jgi:hypothetical protein
MARFKLLPLAFAQNSTAVPKWLRDGGVYGSGCGGTHGTPSHTGLPPAFSFLLPLLRSGRKRRRAIVA